MAQPAGSTAQHRRGRDTAAAGSGTAANADVTKAEEQADKAQLATKNIVATTTAADARRAADDRGLPRLGQEPVGRRDEGPPVDVRRRCRHRVVHDRAPQARGGHAAAAGRGARRGVRQLLPLRVPAAGGEHAVLGRDGRRAVAVLAGPPHPARRRRHEGEVGACERKPAHLVFLVDVSGSMSRADKLELAKQSLRILTDNLSDGDTVSLVTYAGSTRVVLAADRPRAQGDPRRDRRASQSARLDRHGLGHRPRLPAGDDGPEARPHLARDRAHRRRRERRPAHARGDPARSSRAARRKASRCRRSASAWATTRTS